MSEFTPGPWAVSKNIGAVLQDATRRVRTIIEQGSVGTITVIDHPSRAGGNAHLIATAPDLYAALELAVLGKVVNNWLTAGVNVCLVCGELPDSSVHDEHCWVPLAEAALARARGEA